MALSQIRNFQIPEKIPKENLLVATIANNNTDGDIIVGWAQIRPLTSTPRKQMKTMTTMMSDPASRYDSQPGSYDLQKDVDDQMWEEFIEDPDIVVPSGWASLPWAPEYRAMEAGIAKRKQRRERLVVEQQRAQQQQQQREQPTNICCWELASLFVEPTYRGQGIGSELVRRLCREYQETGKQLSNVYLVTTIPKFFQTLGFEEIPSSKQPQSMMMMMEMIPAMIQLRSRRLATSSGSNQVCMKGKNKCCTGAREIDSL